MRSWLAAACLATLAACASGSGPAAMAAPAREATVSQHDPERDYRDALTALESPHASEQAAAEPLLRRSAEAGNVEAGFLLGLAHQTGRGARSDLLEAARWYRTAAEAGHLDAAYLLGLALWRGRGVGQDEAEAVRWFARAAKGGHGPAGYHLALATMLGRGVARDDAAALQELQKAADKGVPEAEYLLGVAHTNGRGVPRDDAWAARWYGRAAQRGVARAQYMTAVSAALGLGLPRDPVFAYRWARIAAATGDAEARGLAAALEARLQPEERLAAERQARAWRPVETGGLADPATVRFVQHALLELGYDPGAVDGLAGGRTEAALSAWQRDAGLPADGRLSQAVLQRLRRERLLKRS